MDSASDAAAEYWRILRFPAADKGGGDLWAVYCLSWQDFLHMRMRDAHATQCVDFVGAAFQAANAADLEALVWSFLTVVEGPKNLPGRTHSGDQAVRAMLSLDRSVVPPDHITYDPGNVVLKALPKENQARRLIGHRYTGRKRAGPSRAFLAAWGAQQAAGHDAVAEGDEDEMSPSGLV
jgi:hypothetical protein